MCLSAFAFVRITMERHPETMANGLLTAGKVSSPTVGKKQAITSMVGISFYNPMAVTNLFQTMSLIHKKTTQRFMIPLLNALFGGLWRATMAQSLHMV